MLPDLIRRGREPSVGITVSDATITLRITASGPDEAACRAMNAPTETRSANSLGVLAYGEEEDELQSRHAAAPEAAATKRWRSPSGRPAAWSPNGWPRGCRTRTLSGGVVLGSGIPYRRRTPRHRTRSAATAETMAPSCRELTGADFGLAVAAFPPKHALYKQSGSGRNVADCRATGDNCGSKNSRSPVTRRSYAPARPSRP